MKGLAKAEVLGRAKGEVLGRGLAKVLGRGLAEGLGQPRQKCWKEAWQKWTRKGRNAVKFKTEQECTVIKQNCSSLSNRVHGFD